MCSGLPGARYGHDMHNAPAIEPATTVDRVGREPFHPPMLVRLNELPGPLSVRQLSALDMVRPLDKHHAYYSRYAGTVQGRAHMVRRFVPHRTIACTLTACWIWVGGSFPGTVDVVSTSHFRTTMFGRKIRVFNRQTPQQQYSIVNGVQVTTPLRTICDIALLADDEWETVRAPLLIGNIMESYDLGVKDCLNILHANRFWQHVPRARQFFTTLEPGSVQDLMSSTAE